MFYSFFVKRFISVVSIFFILLLMGCSCKKTINTKTWTLDSDFSSSGNTYVSVNHGAGPWTTTRTAAQAAPHDQLQMTIPGDTTPFVWIPNTSDGSVSLLTADQISEKVNGEVVSYKSGNELGRYRTCPSTIAGEPSRITIDLDGNCWAANRKSNTLVKIVNRFIEPIVDISTPKNGITTSIGSVMLEWGTDDAVIWEIDLRNSKPQNAGSEIKDINGNDWKSMTYRPGTVHPYSLDELNGARALSTDKYNNIWTGDFAGQSIYQLKYELTGAYMPFIYWKKTDPNSYQDTKIYPYGVVIDRCGYIYFAQNLKGMIRIDPNPSDATPDHPYTVLVRQSYPPVYGITVDISEKNTLYTTAYDEKKLYKWNTKNWTETVDPILESSISTKSSCKGISASKVGVWVANATGNSLDLYDIAVTKLLASAKMPTSVKPHGVSIDSEGHCWVMGTSNSKIYEFEYIESPTPLLKQIGEYEINNIDNKICHYGYNNMTGLVTNSIVSQHAKWIAMYQSPCETSWTVSWSASTPPETRIEFIFVTSKDGIDWVLEPASVTMDSSNQITTTTLLNRGKFIKVRVNFYSNPDCLINFSQYPSPILNDLTVKTDCK